MIVYGDAEISEDPHARIEQLGTDLTKLHLMPAGLDRHARLAALFIAASELAQGLADAAFERRGFDDPDPAGDRALAVVETLAAALLASWQNRFAPGRTALVRQVLAALAVEVAFAPRVKCRLAEGFAHYALYPEAYAAAARALPPPAAVIGLRSIGLGLGAIVARATGAPCVSLRPVGPPFRRTVAVGPQTAQRLLAKDAAPLAIVDEGPGLSGSSFGAVADWLEDRGVAPTRLHFFPGHGGDLGPEAVERHRDRWRVAARHVVDLDTLILAADEPEHRLETWLAAVAGPPQGPLQDVSGGAWRALAYPDESRWPPVWAARERRKFLAQTASGPVLAKFAGLGRTGFTKAAMARALAAAGFSPRHLGLCYGFTVEAWHSDVRRLDDAGVDPAVLRHHVGHYLAFRARHFAALDTPGASLDELWAMAAHNMAEALGPDAPADWAGWRSRLPALQAAARPVRIDGRMASPEWLVCPDGRLLKTDAVDHHAAHDLIGCQDIAWDVAGAAVELGFEADDTERLRGAVQQEAGQTVSADLVAFFRTAYAAFALGAATMALAAEAHAPERQRLNKRQNYLSKAMLKPG